MSKNTHMSTAVSSVFSNYFNPLRGIGHDGHRESLNFYILFQWGGIKYTHIQ